MSKKIIILTIPGIGTQRTGYASRLEEDLIKYSKGTPLENNFSLLETKPFDATEIDENQRALFQRLDSVNNLGGLFSFRKFVMEAFGDGVTFERDATAPDSPYRKIHLYLKERFEYANDLVEQSTGSKLVIVGASLGVHLLSTYIWDADHQKGIFENQSPTAKNNLKNLSHLASIGCNIPLFVSGLRETQIIAFDKRNAEFTWDNYYDKDDVLGWPLKQISSSYNDLVTDYEINTGLYVGSHVKYWDDNDFTKPFSNKLISLIS